MSQEQREFSSEKDLATTVTNGSNFSTKKEEINPDGRSSESQPSSYAPTEWMKVTTKDAKNSKDAKDEFLNSLMDGFTLTTNLSLLLIENSTTRITTPPTTLTLKAQNLIENEEFMKLNTPINSLKVSNKTGSNTNSTNQKPNLNLLTANKSNDRLSDEPGLILDSKNEFLKSPLVDLTKYTDSNISDLTIQNSANAQSSSLLNGREKQLNVITNSTSSTTTATIETTTTTVSIEPITTNATIETTTTTSTETMMTTTITTTITTTSTPGITTTIESATIGTALNGSSLTEFLINSGNGSNKSTFNLTDLTEPDTIENIIDHSSASHLPNPQSKSSIFSTTHPTGKRKNRFQFLIDNYHKIIFFN